MGLFDRFKKLPVAEVVPMYRGTGGVLPKDAEPYERWAEIPDSHIREALTNGLAVFVQSSNVASVIYTADSQDFRVNFHSGGSYAYHRVPPSVVLSFFAAGSKGSFVHETFVKPRWAFTKLS